MAKIEIEYDDAALNEAPKVLVEQVVILDYLAKATGWDIALWVPKREEEGEDALVAAYILCNPEKAEEFNALLAGQKGD